MSGLNSFQTSSRRHQFSELKMNIFLKLGFVLLFLLSTYWTPHEAKRTETVTPSNIQYKFTQKRGRSKSNSVASACTHCVLISPWNSAATSPEHFDAWNYRDDGWSFLVWFVCVLLEFFLVFLETSWKDEQLFRAGPVPGCNFRTPSSLGVNLGRE